MRQEKGGGSSRQGRGEREGREGGSQVRHARPGGGARETRGEERGDTREKWEEGMRDAGDGQWRQGRGADETGVRGT